ncbi:MAG: hypothetical protein AAGC62_09315 [Pseudomonadota bacterium]
MSKSRPSFADRDGSSSLKSGVIRVLSLIVAVYLGVALLFALEKSILRHDGLSVPIALAAFVGLAMLARVTAKLGIGLLLAAGFTAQLLWGALVQPQPFDELGTLWEQARLLAAQLDVDLLYRVASPSAVGLYASMILVFGESFDLLRAIVATLWIFQAWLIWRIASEIAELRPHALAATAVVALSPATIAFSGLPSSEAVFGVFACGAVYVMLSHRRRGLLESAALSGVLVALAFLARPIALAYLVGLMMILVFAAVNSVSPRPRVRLIGAALMLAAGFAAAVAPQALLNYHNEGRFSIAPAPSLGYQLLLGTNQESLGRYNDKDLERAGFVGPNQVSLEEADRNARNIAFERIAADPIGFVVFASTDKMRQLWGGETELLNWSLNSSPRRAQLEDLGVTRWGGLVVDGVYLGFLTAAFLGAAVLFRRRGAVKDPIRWLLIYTGLLTLALAHVFIEVGERYHLAFMPLLALLAPIGATVRLPPSVLSRKGEGALETALALPAPPAQISVHSDMDEKALAQTGPLVGGEAALESDGGTSASPDSGQERPAADDRARRKTVALRGTVARLAEKRAEARAAANASRGTAAELIRQALTNEAEPAAADADAGPDLDAAIAADPDSADSADVPARRGPSLVEEAAQKLPVAPLKQATPKTLQADEIPQTDETPQADETGEVADDVADDQEETEAPGDAETLEPLDAAFDAQDSAVGSDDPPGTESRTAAEDEEAGTAAPRPPDGDDEPAGEPKT